ncbi:hypothetical protein [Streptomyces sp. NPDC002564]|uniref:hypothetical protein n=1 Tax=Streptomyces sp. NPDC002564 TaxID=3364649 RepID=UPI0036915E30
MEAAELAAVAVGLVAATVTGAATGAGESVGAAVTEAVRARLGASERGRAALDRLDADPAAPAAREEAQGVLAEEIEADPEWRRRLVVQVSAPSSRTSDSIVITGSRVSRSHIALGPLTINNTPGTRVFLAAALVLVLALVSLGTYGAVQVFTSDDSPGTASPRASRSTGTSGSANDRAAPQDVTSAEPSTGAEDDGGGSPEVDSGAWIAAQREATEVLPTEDEMPRRLAVRLSPKLTASAEGCDFGVVTYTYDDTYEDVASFLAAPCVTQEGAEDEYDERVSKLELNSRTALKKATMPALGDERAGYVSGVPGAGTQSSHMIVRTGRFVLTFTYGPVPLKSAFPRDLETMMRTFVKKAQERPATL